MAYYWKYFPVCLISETEQAVGSRPNQILLSCRPGKKKREKKYILSKCYVPSLVKTEDKKASVVSKGTVEIREQTCCFVSLAVANLLVYIHCLYYRRFLSKCLSELEVWRWGI